MPADSRAIAGVDDSKRLTHPQRVRLAVKIRERAVAFALGAASVREIERINIYQASALAMHRALSRLKVAPDHVVIDGRSMRTLPVPHTQSSTEMRVATALRALPYSPRSRAISS